MKRFRVWAFDPGFEGILSPGRWFGARAAAWMVLLFIVAMFGLFASFDVPRWLGLPRSFDYPSAILVPLAMLLLYAFVVQVVEKRTPTELSPRHAPLELAGGFVIGFVFIFAILLLVWVCGFYTVKIGHWADWYRYFVFNAYVSAVIEELAFRAILLRILARMFGPIPGVILSAGFFGLAHASHAAIGPVIQIMLSSVFLMGMLYMVSGRLWLSIGAHIGYDWTGWSIMGVGDHDGALIVGPAPGHSPWLTGGDFGPDGSMLAAVVSVMCGLVIYGIERFRLARLSTSQKSRPMPAP